jgi:DNA gyrase/topoisomerase IV subunit B
MAVIYSIAPQFLYEGRLGWLRSPLFIVKNKDKKEFYYTDEEFNAAKKRGITGVITRNKG